MTRNSLFIDFLVCWSCRPVVNSWIGIWCNKSVKSRLRYFLYFHQQCVFLCLFVFCWRFIGFFYKIFRYNKISVPSVNLCFIANGRMSWHLVSTRGRESNVEHVSVFCLNSWISHYRWTKVKRLKIYNLKSIFFSHFTSTAAYRKRHVYYFDSETLTFVTDHSQLKSHSQAFSGAFDHFTLPSSVKGTYWGPIARF